MNTGHYDFSKSSLGARVKTHIETYEGHKIHRETDAWALNYGMNFYVTIGERKLSGKTVDDVKDEIDEYIERNS